VGLFDSPPSSSPLFFGNLLFYFPVQNGRFFPLFTRKYNREGLVSKPRCGILELPNRLGKLQGHEAVVCLGFCV